MIGMNEGKIKVNFGNEKFMYNIEDNYHGKWYKGANNENNHENNH